MSEKLVSILTPCYNTGHLLWRLLDSVLAQTYPFIEMFIIDDGSTDNTRAVYDVYSNKFQKRGYVLNYIYQENQGQSMAINNGLKLINGEYLVWPDSDDFYATTNAIEKMVSCLSSFGEEYAMVRSFQRIINEDTLEEISICVGENKEDYSLFEDCLFHFNGFYFGAGAYMVRTKALAKTTEMSIYTHRDAGQNWQIFLPILYNYRCLTLKEILYNVIARSDSHSRNGYSGYEREIKRVDVYESTILNTLDRINEMPSQEKDHYKFLIRLKYSKERLSLSYFYRQRENFISEYYNLANISTAEIKLPSRVRLIAVRTRTEFILDFLIKLRNRKA